MARSNSTFAKRQKERARQEKQRAKMERRQQRKHNVSPSDQSGPPIEENVDLESPTSVQDNVQEESV